MTVDLSVFKQKLRQKMGEWQDDKDFVVILNISKNINAIQDLLFLLNPEERERSRRFVVDRPRNEFLSARILLKLLLSTYLNVSVDSLEFSYNQWKKPFVAVPEKCGIYFNVSHTRDWVAILLSASETCGIDIQSHQQNTDVISIAKRYFFNEEYALLLTANTTEQKEFFYTMWAAKETIIKAMGMGMYYPLDHVNVSACIQEKDVLVQVCAQCEKHSLSEWFLRSHMIDPDLSLFWTSGPEKRLYNLKEFEF